MSPRTYYPVGHPKHKVRTHTSGNHDGKKISKWTRGHFIAWDTEGAAINRVHSTIYASSATAGGVVASARFPHGATSRELLDWLVESLALNPRAIHVGFAFSYDVSMMLRDIPLAKARELFQYGYVTVDFSGALFSLQYQPRKCFTVRRWERGKGWGPGGRIWDVFGYFQSSFVSACERWDVAAQDVISSIESMKAQRSTFDPKDLDQIARYCDSECIQLAKLTAKLHTAVVAAGLKPKRYDGPGALAAALLDREGIRGHLPARELSYDVLEASRGAYYGGRIECARFGNTNDPVYRYDLVSAYPWAASRLPGLARGRWVHESGEGWSSYRLLSSWGFARVSWDFRELPGDKAALGATLGRLYPFAWRDPMDGNVFFPPKGHAWTTYDELRAALVTWPTHCVTVHEAYEWHGEVYGKDGQPFGFVPELFELRAQWKRDSNPAEKVLKLALNSLYGKLAQRHAQKRRGADPLPPAWQCLPWASWITGTIRSRLYLAAHAAGDSLLMIATDAIFTTAEQPALDRELGAELGLWEKTTARGATIVQSGVYWLDVDDESKAYTRGFDPDSITRAQVIDGWARGVEKLEVTDRRFVGLRQAAAGAWKHRCQWQDDRSGARDLQLAPHFGKRWLAAHGRGYFGKRAGRVRPDAGLVATYAALPVWCEKDELSASLEYPWLTTESGEPRYSRVIHDEQDDAEL